MNNRVVLNRVSIEESQLRSFEILREVPFLRRLGMETRMKKYRQVSPERAKVWTEKSPKYHQSRKVPVIYYLSRNRQLEHPHFMEVPLSSPDGLYLRGSEGKTYLHNVLNLFFFFFFILMCGF